MENVYLFIFVSSIIAITGYYEYKMSLKASACCPICKKEIILSNMKPSDNPHCPYCYSSIGCLPFEDGRYIIPVFDDVIMRKCPYCRMNISVNSGKCPFCCTSFTILDWYDYYIKELHCSKIQPDPYYFVFSKNLKWKVR